MIPDERDEARLRDAWELPVASIYRSTQFDWQKMSALCGPTSVANALRSLGVAVDRDNLLVGTGVSTIFGLRVGGLTLDQMGQIVRRRSDLRATELRDLDLKEFRAHLALANHPERRYIVNFDRGPLFGWGGGHHSPIGGYLAERDLVFVLDVNQRVGPWLVSAERLLATLQTVDSASGLRRGLLLIE